MRLVPHTTHTKLQAFLTARRMRAQVWNGTLGHRTTERKHAMNRSFILPAVALAAVIACTGARAQVAGTATLAVAKLEVVASGWSAKRQILGQTVYNESSEEVGKII